MLAKKVSLNNTFIQALAYENIYNNSSFSFINIIITSTHDYNKGIAKPVNIGRNAWVSVLK